MPTTKEEEAVCTHLDLRPLIQISSSVLLMISTNYGLLDPQTSTAASAASTPAYQGKNAVFPVLCKTGSILKVPLPSGRLDFQVNKTHGSQQSTSTNSKLQTTSASAPSPYAASSSCPSSSSLPSAAAGTT